MKPVSYRAPGSSRLGKDGVYVNCCAACQSFNNLRKECGKHDFSPAKGGRCDDYVDVFADENLPDALAAYMAGREETVGTDTRGGFESLAALVALRDQLLQAFDVMEQEPLPERYSEALPELAADIDRLADWLDGQRQWVAEVHGQQRMARWQEMLERVSRLTVQERLLVFPLLRSKWERIYVLNALRRDRIGMRSGVFLHGRAALTVLLGFIRTAYVMLERFPAAQVILIFYLWGIHTDGCGALPAGDWGITPISTGRQGFHVCCSTLNRLFAATHRVYGQPFKLSVPLLTAACPRAGWWLPR